MAQNFIKILDYLKIQDEKLQTLEQLLKLSKNVLNIDEVSLLTSISKSTLYKYTHTGRVPFYKQAGHLFFDKQEVENWLKSNKGFSKQDTSEKASSYVILNKGGNN